MTNKEFNQFLNEVLDRTKEVLASKSDDYSGNNDKLFNFKLAACMDNITPVEALRGMHLKHRASIVQGLDDLHRGKVRDYAWWKEKLTDDRNYSILLEALLYEEYFGD